MHTTELVAVLVAWYGPGFATAAVMTRRGHAPLPWIYAAWIGGALCVPAAAVWTLVVEPRLDGRNRDDVVVDLTTQPRGPAFEATRHPPTPSVDTPSVDTPSLARPGPTTKRRIR